MHKLSRWLVMFLIWAGSSIQAGAQAPETNSSADVYRKLEKLKVLGNVLYIAAHPDDENNRLLAYLARGRQYRTGYLSLTRGDGGQNLIGTEQGVELGLVRTQELLAARRIDGAEQFFGTAYDFGFSKNATEALAVWGHDKMLSDVVWVIRRFKPDVIITRFPGDARAGHGHHWASALLANEAFTAAADSTRFPEQLRYGIKPWQAKRIVWNAYNFGGNVDTTGNGSPVKMDVGGYDALLGKSYGEIAADSRSQHKTQAFGTAKQRGQWLEYFITTGGDAPRQDLMDDINTSWTRMAGGSEVEAAIDRILASYNFAHPEYSVDSLVALQKLVLRLPANHLTAKKIGEINELILLCSGIIAEATTNSAYAVAGEKFKLNFTVNKRSNTGIQLKEIRFGAFDSVLQYQLPVNQNFSFTSTFDVDIHKKLTQPYWLEKPMSNGSFTVDDQMSIGKGENDPDYSAQFIFRVNDVDIAVTRPVQCKYVDPAKGELYEPFPVITPIVVSMSPNVILTNVQPGNELTKNPQVMVQYKANFSGKQIPVQLKVSQVKYNVLLGDSVIAPANKNSRAFVKDTVIDLEPGKLISVAVPVKEVYEQKSGMDNRLRADVTITRDGHRYTYSNYLRVIKYDHIPDVSYNYRDMVKLVPEEVKTKGKTIGYITGAGDHVPEALVQMGFDVKLLSERDITADNLKQFDAIITGVRAHNVHDYLYAKYETLMEYIHNGGNLIVQYDTNTGLSPVKGPIGPYPFTITTTRVTDENATVKFLLPNHPALNYPNKITDIDFQNWIQERSTYHAAQLDSHYEAPLSMADNGEAASNGSLIIAAYGKGNFVYTGLVFFRQLPAGVGGAYRLMANLIALPQHKTN